jgi:hypothetical protein
VVWTPDQVRRAVAGVLEQLEHGGELDALADALDALMAAGRHAPAGHLDADAAEPERWGYEHARAIVTQRFPALGSYNIPRDVVRSIGETMILVGDAVDDLADIVGDLSEVSWCFERARAEDALFYLKLYEFHWGAHASNLRWYLDALRGEA